jgi:HSP20 family protein
MVEHTTKLPVNKESTKVQGSPWRPFNDLRYEIDRLFDDFGRRDWMRPFRPSIETTLAKGDLWMAPAIDFADSAEAYTITAELPGMDPANLDVTLRNGNIVIRGEKHDSTEDKSQDYYVRERRYGSFERSFVLPEGVDPRKIEATFRNGVLSISLPKTAEAQTPEKKVEIKAA